MLTFLKVPSLFVLETIVTKTQKDGKSKRQFSSFPVKTVCFLKPLTLEKVPTTIAECPINHHDAGAGYFNSIFHNILASWTRAEKIWSFASFPQQFREVTPDKAEVAGQVFFSQVRGTPMSEPACRHPGQNIIACSFFKRPSNPPPPSITTRVLQVLKVMLLSCSFVLLGLPWT